MAADRTPAHSAALAPAPSAADPASSPIFDALAHFAQNAPATGLVTFSGARAGLNPSAQAFAPVAPAPCRPAAALATGAYTGPTYAPIQAAAAAKDQALSPLAFLNIAEGRRSIDAYWGAYFWHLVVNWMEQLGTLGQ